MAEREKESLKKHGDELEAAMKDADRHAAEAGLKGAGGKQVDPIPMPDNGGHEKSHAAHLGGTVHDRTKPVGDIRQRFSASTDLREPPMVVERVGKQHRG